MFRPTTAPMATFNTHPTPNPNSLKITTDAGPFLEEGMAAFRSAEEAEGHPLGSRLFSIAGVTDLLIMPDFLTVTKQTGAKWDILMPKVKQVLQEHFEGEE